MSKCQGFKINGQKCSRLIASNQCNGKYCYQHRRYNKSLPVPINVNKSESQIKDIIEIKHPACLDVEIIPCKLIETYDFVKKQIFNNLGTNSQIMEVTNKIYNDLLELYIKDKCDLTRFKSLKNLNDIKSKEEIKNLVCILLKNSNIPSYLLGGDGNSFILNDLIYKSGIINKMKSAFIHDINIV